MNIQVKQTNHPKNASAERFTVQRRSAEREWMSAIASQGRVTLRIDLGVNGSVSIEIDNLAELDSLNAVIGTAIRYQEDN